MRKRAHDLSDRNALIFSAKGQLIRAFHAGEGIADVQTTHNEEIWVSFFDEGVFAGPEMGPGRSGLVCFSGYGELTFSYLETAARYGLPYIADCYAINVDCDNEVWLYYYTDFPLVRLIDKRLDRIWTNLPIQGSRAFAVKDDFALFARSYTKPDSLFLVSLATMKMEEVLPLNPGGRPIKIDKALGRGQMLYLKSESTLFSIDLENVLKEVLLR